MTRYDIERFLSIRYAFGASFLSGGERLAFLTNITGVPQVWSVPAAGGWPDQLTFYGERVGLVACSPMGPRFVFSMDSGGNERMQLYLAEADGSRVWPLAESPEHVHAFGGWARDGRRVAFAANRRHPAYFDVYVQEAQPGATPQRVLEHDGTNYAAGFSPDGSSLLISRLHAPMENDLFLLDLATGELRPLTEGRGASWHGSPVFHPDGRGIYLVTDHERDFAGLAYLDLTVPSQPIRLVAEPPWDVEEVAVSRAGRRLAFTVNAGGASQLEVWDLTPGGGPRGVPLPLPPLPQGIVSGLEFSPDGCRLAFALQGSRDNLDVWMLDLAPAAGAGGEGPSARVYPVTRSARGGIPREMFAQAEPVDYDSFDGLRIPAFLLRPPRAGGDPLPVVVYVHGGPESQTRAEFDPILQYLVHRGYAVLAPNVRGSTGYGKAYSHLDDVRKRMDSVADLAWAVRWLVGEGIADPGRIAVMGGSYGGFMVLSALTTHPGLWAAGVDIVGIANLETFLENTGPWRRRLREAEYGSLERDREFLRSISPIHRAAQIRAPLLVVHGANDPRVPVSEAEQIVAALRGRGRTVEYLRFEDEGHGIVKLPNRIQAYRAIADFLDRHVGSGA